MIKYIKVYFSIILEKLKNYLKATKTNGDAVFKLK